MDDFEKLSVSRPFGPSVGEFNVKEEFVNDLNEYCKIVLNEEGRAGKLDVGKELAGQVKQEFEVDINFFNLKINNYLTNMIKDYLWKSLEKKTQPYQDFKNKIKVIYKNKWIVRQFENEYNPLHFHTGSMSGVCYILLPKNFGEKSQNQKKIIQMVVLLLLMVRHNLIHQQSNWLLQKLENLYYFQIIYYIQSIHSKDLGREDRFLLMLM